MQNDVIEIPLHFNFNTTQIIDCSALLERDKEALKEKEVVGEDRREESGQVVLPPANNSATDMRGKNGLEDVISSLESRFCHKGTLEAVVFDNRGDAVEGDDGISFTKDDDRWFEEGGDFLDDTEFDVDEQRIDMQKNAKLKYKGWFIHSGPLRDSLHEIKAKVQPKKKRRISSLPQDVDETLKKLSEFMKGMLPDAKEKLKSNFPNKLDNWLIEVQNKLEPMAKRDSSNELLPELRKQLKKILGFKIIDIRLHLDRVMLVSKLRSHKSKLAYQFETLKRTVQTSIIQQQSSQYATLFPSQTITGFKAIYERLFESIGEDFEPYLDPTTKPNISNLASSIITCNAALNAYYIGALSGSYDSSTTTQTANPDLVILADECKEVLRLITKVMKFANVCESILDSDVIQNAKEINGLCQGLMTRVLNWAGASKTSQPCIWIWTESCIALFHTLSKTHANQVQVTLELRGLEAKCFGGPKSRTKCSSREDFLNRVLSIFSFARHDNETNEFKNWEVSITVDEISEMFTRENHDTPSDQELKEKKALVTAKKPAKPTAAQSNVTPEPNKPSAIPPPPPTEPAAPPPPPAAPILFKSKQFDLPTDGVLVFRKLDFPLYQQPGTGGTPKSVSGSTLTPELMSANEKKAMNMAPSHWLYRDR